MDAYLEAVDSAGPLPTLKGRILSIGSASACDIVIDNPTVSRCHATLKKAEATWTVEDLSSTNGTWVNGRSVRHCKLESGDHIAFGSARFFFLDGPPITVAGNRDASAAKGQRLLDRILALPPYEFEKKTAELFTKLGFESIVTQQTGDGGIDVRAVNNGVIFRGRYLIQCKRYSPRNRVSRSDVTSFCGSIASEPGAKGIFVTTSAFTRKAREFALSTGINLIDGDELERLFLRHGLL